MLLVIQFEDKKKFFSIQTQMLSLIILRTKADWPQSSRVAFQKAGIGSNTYQILQENNVIKILCPIKTPFKYKDHKQIF